MNDSISTDNKFAAIPNWVIESKLTPQAGWLYVWLKKYADYSTNGAFPSRKTLAENLGLAKAASVDRYIKELECIGALRVAPRWDKDKDGRRTSNLYTVVTVNPHVTLPPTPVPYRGQGVSRGGDGAYPVEGTVTKNQENKNQKNSSSAPADAGPRPDVLRICNLLADRIEANGVKRPRITKTWLDEARRLMDRDGYTEAEVAAVIEWCQSDQFWKSNILSMPKLRDKFAQLKMKAGSTTTLTRPKYNPWNKEMHVA